MFKFMVIALATGAVVLAGSAALRADPLPSKAKWEYRVVQVDPSSAAEGWTKQLNDWAAEGWEFDATFHEDHFVLRRPVK